MSQKKITSVVLLLFVLTLMNCSNLLKRDCKSHLQKNSTSFITKNQKSQGETFESLKDQFSMMTEKLVNFEKEAQAKFHEDLTVDQEHKLMHTLGGQLKSMQTFFNQLHRKFHNLADEGKVDQENIKVLDKKFTENDGIFTHIYMVGKQKMAEIKQKAASASFITKNQKSQGETFESLKDQFSMMTEKLVNFEKEAQAKFHEDLTVDQEHKLMRTLGGQLKSMQTSFNQLHRKFHDLADEGKVDQENIKVLDKKFTENSGIFTHIYMVGKQKMAEIKQKAASAVPSTSFISREGTMKDMKNQVGEIMANLTNFEHQAHEKFAQKNVADDQEEKMMKDLGSEMEIIEKKAKKLHSIFEDISKRTGTDKDEVKAVEDSFKQVQNLFEVIFAMGEKKIEEIKKSKKGDSKKRLRKPSKKDDKPSKKEQKPSKKEQKPSKKDDKPAKKIDMEKGTGFRPPMHLKPRLPKKFARIVKEAHKFEGMIHENVTHFNETDHKEDHSAWEKEDENIFGDEDEHAHDHGVHTDEEIDEDDHHVDEAREKEAREHYFKNHPEEKDDHEEVEGHDHGEMNEDEAREYYENHPEEEGHDHGVHTDEDEHAHDHGVHTDEEIDEDDHHVDEAREKEAREHYFKNHPEEKDDHEEVEGHDHGKDENDDEETLADQKDDKGKIAGDKKPHFTMNFTKEFEVKK